jgi:hypothetical protein
MGIFIRLITEKMSRLMNITIMVTGLLRAAATKFMCL